MDTNVVSAIISAVSGLLGALIGGRYAYKGSIDGALRQIEAERNKVVIEQAEKDKIAETIVYTFLFNELRHNYVLIHDLFNDKIMNYDVPFQHGYSKLELKFVEYDKIKYDLVRFGTEKMEKVIELYEYFKYIDSKHDFKQFVTGDYKRFKSIYLYFDPIIY